jgi:type II secretion system protein C
MEKALTKYFWVLNLVTLLLMAFLVANGTGQMVAASVRELLPAVEPAPQQRAARARARSSSRFTRRDGTDILRRNIFDSIMGPIIPSEDAIDEADSSLTADGELPLVECSPGQAKLLATVASDNNPSWSFATIESGGQRDLYRIGDEVDDRTISGITWRYLFLRGTSDECYIDLFGKQEPGKPKPRDRGRGRGKGDIEKGIHVDGPNERTVERTVVDQALANPAQFARSVRVRPYKKNGEVTGFRLRRIKKGSPLELLGAQKGDIIHSVNGVELTSVDKALAAYQSLRTENQLVFSVTRKGKPVDLTINIR